MGIINWLQVNIFVVFVWVFTIIVALLCNVIYLLGRKISLINEKISLINEKIELLRGSQMFRKKNKTEGYPQQQEKPIQLVEIKVQKLDMILVHLANMVNTLTKVTDNLVKIYIKLDSLPNYNKDLDELKQILKGFDEENGGAEMSEETKQEEQKVEENKAEDTMANSTAETENKEAEEATEVKQEETPVVEGEPETQTDQPPVGEDKKE